MERARSSTALLIGSSMEKVVVTGMGCLTPLGVDVASTWRSLCRGESAVGPITRFDARRYPCTFCRVPPYEAPALSGRFARWSDDKSRFFALAAVAEALADAQLDEIELDRQESAFQSVPKSHVPA